MVGTPRKLLIVDPDAELRGAVASVLAGYNYSVSQASGATEALTVLDADPPELALLDLGSGEGVTEGGSLDLVREIRARPLPIVCVAMSPCTEAAAAVAAQRAGVADHLLKPVPLETLLAALDRGFERVSRERQMALAVDELAEAKDALRHAERAKIAVLSSTRRELRQPLNAMLGHAEILRSQLYGPLGDSRYVDYAERLIADLRRLIDLVGRIGDRAAIEAGVLTLAEKPLDVVALVAECIAESRAGRHGEGRAFDSDLPAEPLILNADPWRLRQAIADAVCSAAKFNMVGGRVAVSLASNEARDVEIRIESERPGLAPETQAAALAAVAEASGGHAAAEIGLHHAEKFIAMHGGSMKWHIVPNAGAVISLTLPASRLVADAPSRPGDSPSGPSRGNSRSHTPSRSISHSHANSRSRPPSHGALAVRRNGQPGATGAGEPPGPRHRPLIDMVADLAPRNADDASNGAGPITPPAQAPDQPGLFRFVPLKLEKGS